MTRYIFVIYKDIFPEIVFDDFNTDDLAAKEVKRLRKMYKCSVRVYKHIPVRRARKPLETDVTESNKHFNAVLKGFKESEEEYCFEMGYDCEKNGANTTNCHLSIFSSEAKKHAWEAGWQKAIKEKQAPPIEATEEPVTKRCYERDISPETGLETDEYAGVM